MTGNIVPSGNGSNIDITTESIIISKSDFTESSGKYSAIVRPSSVTLGDKVMNAKYTIVQIYLERPAVTWFTDLVASSPIIITNRTFSNNPIGSSANSRQVQIPASIPASASNTGIDNVNFQYAPQADGGTSITSLILAQIRILSDLYNALTANDKFVVDVIIVS